MMAAVLPANLIAPPLAEQIGAWITLSPAPHWPRWLRVAAGDRARPELCGDLRTLIAVGAGLGLLFPPRTPAGKRRKIAPGLAAGVLNSTRQTGNVLGVALSAARPRPSDPDEAMPSPL
jgi:MFS transporter, DHA2 family, methylenomycin A resistance protein